MTDLRPTPITSLTQLPPVTLRGIVAATFELALAEYERKYGAALACWQYQNTFYFEILL